MSTDMEAPVLDIAHLAVGGRYLLHFDFPAPASDGGEEARVTTAGLACRFHGLAELRGELVAVFQQEPGQESSWERPDLHLVPEDDIHGPVWILPSDDA